MLKIERIITLTHTVIKLKDLYSRILVGTCDYSRQILERSYVIYKMKETETSREREREKERERESQN